MTHDQITTGDSNVRLVCLNLENPTGLRLDPTCESVRVGIPVQRPVSSHWVCVGFGFVETVASRRVIILKLSLLLAIYYGELVWRNGLH